jgi:antitoxin component YwqK of YwqJK toxin-antitoxin module/GNAT superfamily N-acetyltransferase
MRGTWLLPDRRAAIGRSGACSSRANGAIWRAGWIWWIQSVFVARDERRSGVYSALHRHVVASARAERAVGLRLYVDADNRAAQSTYERLGWRAPTTSSTKSQIRCGSSPVRGGRTHAGAAASYRRTPRPPPAPAIVARMIASCLSSCILALTQAGAARPRLRRRSSTPDPSARRHSAARAGPIDKTLLFADGKKAAEGEMKNGRREGAWCITSRTARSARSAATRTTSAKVSGSTTTPASRRPCAWAASSTASAKGVWTRWHPTGTKIEEGRYEADLQEGKWTQWYSSGALQAEGEFHGARKDGVWVTYHPDGKAKFQEGTFRRGMEDGPWIYWHANGQKYQEGSFVLGVPMGKWTTWHDNGQKQSEGVYDVGGQTGVWTKWHPSGNKEFEGAWNGGKEQGPWQRWHSNGELEAVGSYDEGNMVGDWTTYHPNGQKASVALYHNGKLNGPFRNWFENGQKQSEGDFVLGKKEGAWKFWNDDGTPNEQGSGNYKNDRRVKSEDEQ